MGKRINSFNSLLKSNVEIKKRLYNRSDMLRVLCSVLSQLIAALPLAVVIFMQHQGRADKNDVFKRTVLEQAFETLQF